ncbi:MAG: ComF family protein [Elusimicrobia bacterium]|nr:ComF family protein [Elusimicrobiota bacterium]
MLRYIVNFIYPPFCQGCGKLLPLSAKNLVCENCLGEINKEIPGAAEFSGYRLFFSGKYDGILRELIIKFKFRNSKTLANFFGNIMAENFVKFHKTFMPDLIVAVPLHKKKKDARGFNQSELLAKRISKILRIPVAGGIIKRVKNTQPQKNLPKAERNENIKGAFKSKKLNGEKILIVDDVHTTGATISECVRTLKENGAGKIAAIVIAKT